MNVLSFPTLNEMVRSIYGVVRLARFDARGAELLEGTPEAAARSFWVAALVLPFQVLIVASQTDFDIPEGAIYYLILVEALAYVVSWTAFPVIMEMIARPLEREKEFFAMVVAYNWSAVIRTAIRLPQVLLLLGNVLTEDEAASLGLVVLVAILVYVGFIFRTTLRIDGFTAAGLVVLKLLSSALIGDYADQLLDWSDWSAG
jgi:hypothetical protein